MNALVRDARRRLTGYPGDVLGRALDQHPLLVLRALKSQAVRDHASSLALNLVYARVQYALQRAMKTHGRDSFGTTANDDDLIEAARILKGNTP